MGGYPMGGYIGVGWRDHLGRMEARIAAVRELAMNLRTENSQRVMVHADSVADSIIAVLDGTR